MVATDSQKKAEAARLQESAIKETLDGLTAAFYNAFTNKAGVRLNIQVIYELFIPHGMIIKTAGKDTEIYNLEQFIEPREKLLNEGLLVEFAEEEVSERTELFGNIAHRFSLYRKSGVLSGEAFETLGMKSIQFVKTSTGWKISSLAWDDEREGLAIPDKYKSM